MNHPATFVLPLAAGRVLDVLHTVLHIGEIGIVSHAEIARAGHISEASVSTAMPVLVEHGFLSRVWDDTLNHGRGGYLITLLPLDDSEATHPQLIGSTIDPRDDEQRLPPQPPQTTPPPTAPRRDQQLIGSAPNMDDHDSSPQQQPRARVFVGGGASGGTPDQDRPDQVFPRQWRQILAANPGYTAADFDRELAAARKRPDVRNPIRFVTGLRGSGESVYSLEDLHARATDRPEPTGERRRSADPTRRHHPQHAGRARTAEQYTPPSDAEIADTRARWDAAPPLVIDITLPELRREWLGCKHAR